MNSLFNTNKENNFSLFFSIVFHILIFIFAYFIKIESETVPVSIVEIEFQNDKKVSDEKNKKVEVEKKNEKTKTLKKGFNKKKTSKKNIVEKNSKLNEKKNNKPKSKVVESNKNVANIKKNNSETDLKLNEKKNGQFQSNTIDSNKNIENQNIKNGNDVNSNQIPTINWNWMGGRSRKRLSGVIPEYPEDINVIRAKIKIKVTVRPDGRVANVFPIEISNKKLVEAIIKEVRNWQFDMLDMTYKQINQECEITFIFKSK